MNSKSVVYFCAEYGIEGLPIYAGGLGMLAEDFFQEAGDEDFPLIAIGLFYHGGIHHDGKQSSEEEIDLHKFHFQEVLSKDGKPLILDIDIKDKIVRVKVWVKDHKTAKLFLFDTNISQNDDEIKKILFRLYDPDSKIRVLQQLVLGIGGIKLLRALNIEPDVYHLNEGYTSFAALALIAEYFHDHPEENSLQRIVEILKPKIVATKHTILSVAGLYIDKTDFYSLTSHYFNRHRINCDEFFALGIVSDNPEVFSTTRLMFNVSSRANGVSMLHTVYEKKKHPYGDLVAITNGVYRKKWLSPLWPKTGLNTMNDKELWLLKKNLRVILLDFVFSMTGKKLDPEVLTVVWARRFAEYKRPFLLFSDIERLKAIANKGGMPIQFIIAGKAYETDMESQKIVSKIKEYSNDISFNGRVVYLPDYSISITKKLVAGADIWLNTPVPGVEACGTSGMKAGLNGALQTSTNDGWIGEVNWKDIGWVLSEDHTSEDLYDVFENKIAPMFYERGSEDVSYQWIKQMRETIQIVESRFTTERMLKDYTEKLYFPGQSS